MGHVVHHAIIITTFDREVVSGLHAFAKQSGASVTDIVESNTNGDLSFMLGTDGSKSGWGTSDKGDIRRSALIEKIKSYDYDDGSNPVEWVEVSYSSDDKLAEVTNSRWGITASRQLLQQHGTITNLKDAVRDDLMLLMEAHKWFEERNFMGKSPATDLRDNLKLRIEALSKIVTGN